MRVAIVAESFLPEINGFTNSVLLVIERLGRTGLPGFSLPMYRSLSIGIPTGQGLNQLEGFNPDVVHLAAPRCSGRPGCPRSARSQTFAGRCCRPRSPAPQPSPADSDVALAEAAVVA
ncbi:MAG: hypothetical protein ACRDZ8_13215 [Acidimicrobiales bacterium]